MHAAPDASKVDIDKIHNTPSVLGLVLAFHISFAIAARKTAQILRQVFKIHISYQTVLNYAEAAAPYCNHFNLTHKGDVDDNSAGDETYIKILGKHAFVFLFISANNHKITAYHVANSRDTLPATAAMTEAIRTAKPRYRI
jgi:transposase-like protein